MDVLILGAMVVVLIAITVWVVVWPSRATDSVDGAVRGEEVLSKNTPVMTPQGDQFQDQYTSATADLSAGGVATSLSGVEPAAAPELSPYQAAAEPWSEPSLAREGAQYPVGVQPRLPAPAPRGIKAGKTIGVGAAALLTLGGAAAGAWLYSRWQHERRKPLNRLKRLF